MTAFLLMERFRRTGDRRDLDRAVEGYRTALRETSGKRDDRIAAANLRACLWTRWSSFGDDRDRDDLIALYDEARPGAETEQDALFLGVALSDRFDNEHRRDDLDGAIGALRRAVEAPLEPSRNRAFALLMLGTGFRRRYEEAGDQQDLAEAVSAGRGALSHAGPGDPLRPRVMTELALTRECSFQLTGDLDPLNEALVLLRAALVDCPRGARRRATVLDHLARILITWIAAAPGVPEFEELLRVTRTALAEAPESVDHPARLRALARLGVALRLAEEHGGGTAMLREAVGLLREAVRHTRPSSPDRVERLNSLGNVLHRLGQRTGDAELLDEAVEVLREAVAGCLPERPWCMPNLAVALRERYHQTGDLASLREAAELARRSVELFEAGRESTAHLDNLGVILQTWYDRTGEEWAAAEAVKVARLVLIRTPETSPEWSERVNHLANALGSRREEPVGRADLDEAIRLLTRAAEALPYGDPGLPRVLHNLSTMLAAKAQATEDRALLEQAVTTAGRAVWAPSEGEAADAGHLWTYARSLRSLYDVAGDPGVLRAAEDVYRQVAENETVPAVRRIRAARDWGAAAAEGRRWSEATRAFRLAVDLLPFGITQRLGLGDREHGLARVQGLAADAAACAVNAGDPELAVLLLEQGRGVLLWQAIAPREGWQRLLAVQPRLAARFLRLRDEVEALDVEERSHTTDDRHRLAVEWERLVARIRALPGFADFLAAPTLSSLLSCADRGPVVLAYCSSYRSDALILRPEGVLVVPLPEAGPGVVEHQVARLEGALAAATDPAGERNAQQTVRAVLAWAWDHVAGPVLARLGLLDEPPGDDWPRLWWSPGGALAALPLHAAGHHDGRRAVVDRVISSYTPTVRALAYARARAADPSPPGRLLVVTQPETPGARPLHGARREVAKLVNLLPFDLITGEDATTLRILRELPEFSYVHFACHGVSDPDDPSHAQLLVHDHQRHPLTAHRVSRLDLPRARLAVLSACVTARASKRLADEFVHITSAFQVAGYPHVIGTLWQVHDAVSVRVTGSFYRFLRRGRPSELPGLDAERSAAALHHAVRECREAFHDVPSLWAAYVHSGA
ncbi:CHAT domain-containing protein [Kitasatospora sp. NPDC058218]|uniref:CHAT domain-containing tetratricopeptide repeat protein n=1 Tax=Kitasatospora sp. NPDC058218 TaxID=3346385 RepID=UPI0036DC2008